MNVLDINEVNVALRLGQCRFQQELGKGMFGFVVRVIHEVTHSYYAVKMTTIDSEERTKYLKRELDILTKVEKYQNITQYFTSWVSLVEDKQIVCIQMELCWLSLQDYVLRNGLYVPSIAIVKNERFYKHIFPQILNGLNAIHSVGWVHRDIHPSNILIANPKPSGIQDIVIKIAGFGLARRIGEVVEHSSASLISPHLGNWLYRAPELSTPYYNYKDDLYSAGIVLYFLCRYLENTEQWKDEIKQLREGKRQRDHLYHNDEMWVEAVELLNNLLKVNPGDRPSAREALDMCPLNETDGPNSLRPCVYFLTRKIGEDAYNRCCAPDDSLFGIKVAVENGTGIKRENQVLRQEYIVDGEKNVVNINCDKDVKEMFKSAEKANCKVTLIASEEETAAVTVLHCTLAI